MSKLQSAYNYIGAIVTTKKEVDVYSYVPKEPVKPPMANPIIGKFPPYKNLKISSYILDFYKNVFWEFSDRENPGIKEMFGVNTIYIKHTPQDLSVDELTIYQPPKPRLTMEEKILKYGKQALFGMVGVYTFIQLSKAYITRPKQSKNKEND